MKDAKRVQSIKIEDKAIKFLGFNLRMLLFISLVLCVNGTFLPVIIGQRSGQYFRLKYPNCTIKHDKIVTFGDGTCHGGLINSYFCAFDGGDCIDFNIAYPTCNKAANPELVGDGTCHEEYNYEDCQYDGGDCCDKIDDDRLGDGICHGGFFFSAGCLYDKGDC